MPGHLLRSELVKTAEHFFAPCPRGLEAPLAGEIQALGAKDVDAVAGGVGFSGPYVLCYTVNLESRIASRVLWQVGHAPYASEADIYEAVRRLPWPDWFGPKRTIRVDVSAIRSPLKSLEFITLRIKDGICDVFRAAAGRRPNVDTRRPDVRIYAFLTSSDCTFYLDTSGEALFKRGYRGAANTAPLRENLAAGILRLTGWQPGTPLLDPMCGSGTFLAEAAMIDSDMAPGAYRRFGFEKLERHESGAWRAMQDQARGRRRESARTVIYGSDRSHKAVRLARTNLAGMGLEANVRLSTGDIFDLPAPGPEGILVTNPPYGVRMEEQEELAEFYPRLGDVLKRSYSGWKAYILTADMRLPKLIRLAATRRTPLFNGALDCRLFEYKLVEGSNRKRGVPAE